MEVATWVLVVMLSVALFIFLIAGIILIVKLVQLSEEVKKIVAAGQQIASKTDDIVDNVKGMTSVGGIVKTFANRVIENQERRYREEDVARAAAEAEAEEVKNTKTKLQLPFSSFLPKLINTGRLRL